MGFNIPDSSVSQNKVSTAILNQIHVDGANVKVLPNGTPPSVVYRIGDDTVHPEGWDNVDGERYLDFYVSTGQTGPAGPTGQTGPAGPQGEKGDVGDLGFTPIVEMEVDSNGDLVYEIVGYEKLTLTSSGDVVNEEGKQVGSLEGIQEWENTISLGLIEEWS